MLKNMQSIRSITGIAFGLMIAANTFTPVEVKAQPTAAQNLKGWVWFNGSSAPDPYQYNSKGGTNTVTRLGVGRYTVNLPKLGIASGTVHVTSYNSDRHCKVVNWGPSGSTQRVNVNCFQPNGTRADSKFSMLFYKRSGRTSGTDAYLWYNGSTASSTYGWNSRGLKNSVSKLGTGRYQAKLPGMNKLGGTVLVTAYGSDAAKCKVVNWRRFASNTTVNVNCFQGNKPVNSKFTLSYINGTNGVGLGFRHKGAYVWGNSPNARGTYIPSTTYQWNSATSSNNSIKITNLPPTGSYRVNLPQLIPANKTNTQVTAYGNNSDYCNISSWVSDGSGGTNANVKCFNFTGKPVDSRFTLTYLTNKNTRVSPSTRTNVLVNLTTGSDDLRGGNNAFITLNLTNGTSTPEMKLGGGFGQNSLVKRTVTFGQSISLNQIKSITIRHDGSPRSGHPFDTYDNWDLQRISVSLGNGQNIYNSVNDPARNKFVHRFTGNSRQIVLPRQ